MADYEKTIVVRLTKADDDKIRDMAKKKKVGLSEYMRTIIKEKIKG